LGHEYGPEPEKAPDGDGLFRYNHTLSGRCPVWFGVNVPERVDNGSGDDWARGVTPHKISRIDWHAAVSTSHAR
jgi:hypothetical protein